MKKFKQIRRAASGYIADIENVAGGGESVYLMHVAAAITKPSGFDPGYYLVLGVQFEQTPDGLFKLMHIAEKESLSRNRLIRDFLDACVRYNVEMVYASRGDHASSGQSKYGFFHTLHNAATQYRAKWQLLPAPSVDDPLYGMALLREYIEAKAVRRPADSLYKQKLSEIGFLDTTDTDAVKRSFNDSKLNVFHAVRYILAGIDRDISPMAKPGAVYDLEAQRFFKTPTLVEAPSNRESGFFL